MAGEQEITILDREVRWTLQRLYNPEDLPHSPLIAALGMDGPQAGMALREILLTAIEALRPASDVPVSHPAWRLYGALYHRYVDLFPQHEVAKTLGLSVRQLRREEHHAICVLAEQLMSRYRPQRAAVLDHPLASAPQAPGDAPPGSALTREQELDWLHRSSVVEALSVPAVIQAAVRTVAPLSHALQVSLTVHVPEGLSRLRAPETAVRQVLVNILSAAVRSARGSAVTIAARAERHLVDIDVQHDVQPATSKTTDWAESMEMARKLADLCGGTLQVSVGVDAEAALTVCLSLPAVEEAAVLVIDDNADALQLFERFLANSPYSYYGATDPRQALALAQDLQPRVIVLDIMLPGMDGWELLGRLRADPGTGHIPVIICTILPEFDLAQALGAAGFLRKPLSQGELLAALARLTQGEQLEAC
jgi:CheY-like chemotaxis protein